MSTNYPIVFLTDSANNVFYARSFNFSSMTPEPAPATLRLLRETLAPELAALYPQFGARVFGIVPRAAE